jgi:hypothetical protein
MKPTIRLVRIDKLSPSRTFLAIVTKTREAIEASGHPEYAKEFLARAANTPTKELLELAREYVEVFV